MTRFRSSFLTLLFVFALIASILAPSPASAAVTPMDVKSRVVMVSAPGPNGEQGPVAVANVTACSLTSAWIYPYSTGAGFTCPVGSGWHSAQVCSTPSGHVGVCGPWRSFTTAGSAQVSHPFYPGAYFGKATLCDSVSCKAWWFQRWVL